LRGANLGFVLNSNRQYSARDSEQTKAAGNFVRNERDSGAGGVPEDF
jgi:hypothetical protein